MNPLLPRYCLLLYLSVAFFSVPAYSQTVIGGDTIDASAMLDVQSIDKGVLLPRMTTAQRNAIPNPAFGLLVLNTTLQCVEINLGSAIAPEWKCLSTGQGILNLSALDTVYWNRKLNGRDTLGLSARIDGKLSAVDTVSLSKRIDGKLSSFIESDPVFQASLAKGITAVDTMYWNNKLNEEDTIYMLANYVNIADTAVMLNSYLRKQDTLSLSDRINSKHSFSDTLLASFLKKVDTVNLSYRIDTKLAIEDTTAMLLRYLRKSDTLSLSERIDKSLVVTDTTAMLLPYLKKRDTLGLSNRISLKLNIADTSLLNLGTRFADKLGPGDTLSLSARIDSKLSSFTENDPLFHASIARGITGMDTAYWSSKLNPSDTMSISKRINSKLSLSDTASMLANYVHATDTSVMLRPYFRDSDTTLLNLDTRLATKIGPNDTLSLSNRIDSKLNTVDTSGMLANYVNVIDTSLILSPYLKKQDTTSLSNRIDKMGLPQNGNTLGNMLYWDGTNWVRVAAGQNGQVLQLQNGLPVWSGPTFAVVSTSAVSIITSTTATVGGSISSDGGAAVIQRGIVYSTTQNPTLDNGFTQDGNGVGNFASSLVGLVPNTTYYVRAYATNSSGTGYGNQLIFTTLSPSIPILTTVVPTSITQTSAVTGGSISSDGGLIVTQRGVVYGTNPNPTLANSFTLDGSGTGVFTSILSDLIPNTTYYIRAYASNIMGTSYGVEQTFFSFVQMVTLSEGEFFMGCSTSPGPNFSIQCVSPYSTPVHRVTLSSFQIAESEVTQAQWLSLMGFNPSFFSDRNCSECPVERVSWFDAIVFCNRLSEAQGLTPCYYSDVAYTQVYGKNGGVWSLPNSGTVYWNPLTNGYRLPTEAECEYAIRGGPFNDAYYRSNIEYVAWYSGNTGETRPVKSRYPNEYNLYDIRGNVSEWCWDRLDVYTSAHQANPIGPNQCQQPASSLCHYRIFRGGSITNNLAQINDISNRFYNLPDYRSNFLGFRLARTP